MGVVKGIYIADAEGAPVRPVAEIRAVAGVGLEGDRNFRENAESGTQATFIEQEALEALRRDCEIDLAPGAHRRNIVTQGAPLNHLIGQRFRVGEAEFVGIRLCEPCAYLESMTQPGIVKGLVHRGGLRADILRSGAIRPGDKLTVLDE